MGKKNIQGQKLVHPNSRKTKSLVKTLKKISNRKKSKHNHEMRQNVLGEKILWFRDNLPSQEKLTPQATMDIIEKYLHRFDDELEVISAKQSMGGHRQRQHASRQDVINHTIEREREEFMTCGIEVPSMMDSEGMKKLVEWNGELRFIQNLKLARISHKNLLKDVPLEGNST
ncbi:translation machinery-associated protein 16 homolog [Ischnura elegans]|uniref:translation machinery-associated protein 16 homolog n=1 Tax=Ischnura elegans TaxID=197161 RepID=UPI001ED86C26|nr:translation machinery-associated protein 16 homolog [Ischnura elegans]